MMLIDLLLTKGADINVRIEDKLGYTVLMKLVSNNITTKDKLDNTIEIIKFLIERGADCNMMGYNNKSVYEVINSNINNEFYEEIINTLRNTKQTIFYQSEENEMTTMMNSQDNLYSKKMGNPKVVVESNQMRMNCCKFV